MLATSEVENFKKTLKKEQALLEAELSKLGKRDPANAADWIPAKPEGDEFGADRNDNADIIEDMEENSATLNELEGRLNLVTGALEKISEGTYGICDVCGEDIELERLRANPAATTCKTHMR